MSFVDQAAALERERRMQDILDRISNLSDDELKRLDRVLSVQVIIDDTINTEFPISTVSRQTSQSNIKSILSSRIETVKSNLTQILGYTPSDSDIQELIKIRRIYGEGFTGAIRQISATINDIQGGISEVLRAIDTGVTSVIDTATKTAQLALDEANKVANAAISSITSSANAAINSVVSANTINSIRSTTRDLTALINNPLSLVPTLTNYFSASLDERISRIDEELNLISRELLEAASQRANSNVSAQNAAVIQNTVQQGISTPPTNPDPVAEDGTPFYTYPNNIDGRASTLTEPTIATPFAIVQDEERIKVDQYVSNVFLPNGRGGRFQPIISRVVSRRRSNGDYIVRLTYLDFEDSLDRGGNTPLVNSATTIAIQLGNPRAARAIYTNLSYVPREALSTTAISPTARDTILAPSNVDEIVNNFAIPNNATLRT